MRYHRIDNGTKANGDVYPLQMGNVAESSLESLRRFFGKDGVTLNTEFTHAISDRPVFRHATDEELAAGSERIVKS